MILEFSSRIVCIVKLIIDKVGHDMCLKAQWLSGFPPTLVATRMYAKSICQNVVNAILVISRINEIIIKNPLALLWLQVALLDRPCRLDGLIFVQLVF